jgi:CO dehydrogenase nickel-insertion accessory protein CooC1
MFSLKAKKGFKKSLFSLIRTAHKSIKDLLPSEEINQIIEKLEIGDQVTVVAQDKLGESTTRNWYVGEINTNTQILTLVPEDPNTNTGYLRTNSKRIYMDTIKSISVITKEEEMAA